MAKTSGMVNMQSTVEMVIRLIPQVGSMSSCTAKSTHMLALGQAESRTVAQNAVPCRPKTG